MLEFTEDLEKCRNWLVNNNTLDVCMESTGKYSDRFDELLNKKIKKHNKSIKNTDDMISYLTKLGYNITMQNN